MTGTPSLAPLPPFELREAIIDAVRGRDPVAAIKAFDAYDEWWHARSRPDNLRAALDSTRGALVTVAQWDSWASEWLAKHPRDDDDDA